MVKADHETGQTQFDGSIHDWACDIAMLLRDFRTIVAQKHSAKLADELYDEVIKNAAMTEKEMLEDIDKQYGSLENMLEEALIHATITKNDKMLDKIGKFIKKMEEQGGFQNGCD